MIDRTAFRARGPEFVEISDARVDTALADAAARTDASVFGTSTDEAHFWLTAHLLASSPTGREARLSKESEQTLYLVEWQRIVDAVGPGWGSL